MRLCEVERAMLDGAMGEPRRLAMEQQVAVGRFFDAADFVPVTQAHLMADGEAVGEAGACLLERIAAAPEDQRRVRIPTVTDPRGVDPKACARLGQPARALERERRIVAALRALGVLLTDTCINYQTVMAPTFGEHVAFGDTGSTIYANAVCGARSNFEGGVAALWAALSGRVPRYGMHLDAARRGSRAFRLEAEPVHLTDWGALGGVIGRRLHSYFEVPVVIGVPRTPGSDALKHFGAALASYGSTPMAHIVGITPEAPDAAAAFGGDPPPEAEPIGRAELDAFYDGFRDGESGVDVVVFAAPQLSLVELQALAGLLAGRRVSPSTALLVATSPEVAAAARRLGIAEGIERAGGLLLEGVCFYQSWAREIGQANGWRRLLTNSAKLANIIGGYGYTPALASMAGCVEAAVRGRLP
jgi:predicted aconitase